MHQLLRGHRKYFRLPISEVIKNEFVHFFHNRSKGSRVTLKYVLGSVESLIH